MAKKKELLTYSVYRMLHNMHDQIDVYRGGVMKNGMYYKDGDDNVVFGYIGLSAQRMGIHCFLTMEEAIVHAKNVTNDDYIACNHQLVCLRKRIEYLEAAKTLDSGHLLHVTGDLVVSDKLPVKVKKYDPNTAETDSGQKKDKRCPLRKSKKTIHSKPLRIKRTKTRI